MSESRETPLWGAEQIAQEIGRTPRQTYSMLENGYLPAAKVGPFWVAYPSRLRARITGRAPIVDEN